MKFLARISLAMKLWLVVGLFTVGLVVVAVSGLLSARHLAANMALVSSGSVPRLQSLASIGVEARTVRTREFQYLAADSAERQADLIKGIKEAAEKTKAAMAEYAKYVDSKVDRANLKKLGNFWDEYISGGAQLDAVTKSKGKAAGFELVDKTIRPKFVKEFIPALEEMGRWNKEEAAKLDRQGIELNAKSFSTIVTLLAVCILVGVTLAALTVRAIVRSAGALMSGLEGLQAREMSDLTRAMQALENADLTVQVALHSDPIEVEGNDEFSKMARCFNVLQSQVGDAVGSYDSARQSLSKLVVNVRKNADDVSEASRVVADATEQSGRSAGDIASGSEKLAMSASDASNAMGRFRSAIDEIERGSMQQAEAVEEADISLSTARGALDQVASAANQMANLAHEGGRAVSETIDSMESIRSQVGTTAERVRELDEKGQQIGQIVSTIEAIAEQTNLLALNAAIEAARAGDHGRGFAVVADEVRKLAEQSSAATKEIATLIETVRHTVTDTVHAIELAQQCVASGTNQSQAAGDSLHEIVDSATSVSTQLSDVTAASNQLEVAMRKVNDSTTRTVELAATVARDTASISEAIESVASISEEAAAGAQEMSAASEEVAASASELNTLAGKLRGTVTSFEVEEASSIPTLRAA